MCMYVSVLWKGACVMSMPCLQNPLGVTVGGTLGHAICTGLAVIGGKIVAQKISVRTGKYHNITK